ncbi:hypothetical protein SDC9_74746 [bioreactor metagenome]|uniref:Uncharacterized protein n=1 Tax=bioreactor metagenome TaxID=1076179 RepID=A0A644YIV4_9ZZZZ
MTAYRIKQGIPTVNSLNSVIAEIFNFEGEYNEKPVGEFLKFFYPTLFPGPYLWCNIVENLVTILFCIFTYPEVKTWVVYKDHNVGIVFRQVLFAQLEIGGDFAERTQDFYKPHYGCLFVMPDQLTPLGKHKVTTPKPEPGLGVGDLEPFHQVGSMQVPRSLSCYDVVFHDLIKVSRVFPTVLSHCSR